ncbi:MAG: hypothetical protein IJF49_08090 [Clostridia bacterium]|nr:hypothetical protein [Clostridia bacterium]
MKDHHDFDLGRCGSCLHYLLDENKCDFHKANFHPDKRACTHYLPPPPSPLPEESFFEDHLTGAIRKYCSTCPFFHSPEWCIRHCDFADPIRFHCC